MKKAFYLIFGLLLISSYARAAAGSGMSLPDSAQLIVLTDSNVINEQAFNEMLSLYDEQDSVGDPRNGNGGQPQTQFGPLYYTKVAPYSFIIDLGTEHDLIELYACDNSSASHNEEVYVGTPGNWTRINDLVTDESFYTWIQLEIPDTTRFIKFVFTWQSEINELAIYGRDLGTGASPAAPGLSDSIGEPSKDFGNYFMGTCGFYDDPDTLMAPIGATMRQYIPWDYLEWQGTVSNVNVMDSNYAGYPNSTFKLSPNRFNANMDNVYQNWKNLGIDVVPVLQQTATYLRDGRVSTTKPITIGDDPESPQSYEEHSDFMFQFTARYGRGQVHDSLLKLDSNQNRVSGLDLIDYVENWNEPDNWWTNRDAYFAPSELAAMSSADYDGHEGQLGAGYGIKTADSTMKMVMGGLSVIEVDYVKGMKAWSDFNRTSGFPADVINFHHYCNDGGKQRHSEFTTQGISPEDDDLKGRLREIVEYRDLWLPGVEVWITEFGYSTHPDSKQRAVAIGSNKEEETQGRWLLRSFLEISAAGVDRAHQYLLVDQKTENSTAFAADGLVMDRWDHDDDYYVWQGDSIVDTLYHDHNSFQKKKSWYYMACMKRAMSGFHFYQEIESGNPDINLYEFRTDDGDSTVYAVWCNTSTNKVVNNFGIAIGSNAHSILAITPDSTNTTGIYDTLAIINDSISLTVTEMPVFITKIHQDSIGPTAIAQNLMLYLDENGQATIQPTDVDNGSYDNNGIVLRTLSKTSFNCSDVSADTTSVVIVSDSTWLTSTESGTTNWATFPWVGVAGIFPHDSTFAATIVGQPHSWHSIDEVDEAEVLKAGNYVSFHRKEFDLSSTSGLKSRFQITNDDDLEIYVNGHLIARDDEYNGSKGRRSPYHDVYFDQTVTNGYQGGDAFNYVTSSLNSVFVTGTNVITVAVRNGAPGSNGSAGNIGGFSFKMTLEREGIPVSLVVYDHVGNTDTATALIQVFDTIAPTAEAADYTLALNSSGQATLTYQDIDDGSSDNCTIVSYELSQTDFDCADVAGSASITLVSDSTWLRSSVTQARSYPWSGLTANDIPHDSTFIYAAEEGQVVSYELVQPIAGTQPIKAFGDVNIFRKTFTLSSNIDFSAHFQITGDDFFQVLINGTSVGLRSDIGGINPKLPAHQVYYDDLGAAFNGYDSSDSFDSYYNGDISDLLHAGQNTVIVAVSNGSTATGGFSFKMDVNGLSAIPVTLTVEDGQGNTDSDVALVKVVDNIAPVVIARNLSYTLDSTGILALDAASLDSSSTDACGIMTTTVTPQTLGCVDHGANVVTLSLTDSSGNIGYAYPTVTIDTTGSHCVLGSAKRGHSQTSTSSNGSGKVNTLEIYPNPTNQMLHLVSTTPIQSVLIYTVQGKIVKRYSGSELEIQLDLSQLASGVYFVKTERAEGSDHFEVIKE